MASPLATTVISGFSVTNRWLIYTSLMLTPAGALYGLGSNSPINIGFLAYNWYQQYLWFTATRDKQLHALSLLPGYLNLMYSLTYLGGVPAGNVYTGVFLGFCTAGLIVMNTVTAWISWKTNLPEGDGVYQFFFFGWRTLSKGWRTFLLLCGISDTIIALVAVCAAFGMGVIIPLAFKKSDLKDSTFVLVRETSVVWGSAAVLVLAWPLIVWMELIVKKNNIVSETDMIAVYLFIAQVVVMIGPTLVTLVWIYGKEWVSGIWRGWKGPDATTVLVLPTITAVHADKADKA